MIVDTQVISYWFKGATSPDRDMGTEISSVTAAEFLSFQTREDTKPDYYVLHPARFVHTGQDGLALPSGKHSVTKKLAKLSSNRTDSLTIDFGNLFEPYRIFGNEAIAEIINHRYYEVFKVSIAHLSKDQQKRLKKGIEYLFDNGLYCWPVTEAMIELTMQLFIEFSERYDVKQDIKNSISDLLILSTAVVKEKKLLTKDKLLNRFAAEKYSAPISNSVGGISIDFSREEANFVIRKPESKGYIDRGWSYSVRRGFNVYGT